jgi:hypothetical protein
MRMRLALCISLLAIGLIAGRMCAAEGAAPAPGYVIGELLVRDDFDSGLAAWRTELEQGGSVVARDGALDLDVPRGCTVWLARELSGPLLIEYEATAISAGGPHDRVSDLNCFWMARDVRGPADLFAAARSGKFEDYDRLRCYYVGLGGNRNTTTRFRRYVGESGNRPLRPQDDLTAPEFLLVPNVPQSIRLVAADRFVAFDRDGRRLFTYVDDAPYASGWFGFRTVASHLRIRHFRVYRLVKAP